MGWPHCNVFPGESVVCCSPTQCLRQTSAFTFVRDDKTYTADADDCNGGCAVAFSDDGALFHITLDTRLVFVRIDQNDRQKTQSIA